MNYLIVSVANSIRISTMYHRSIRACLLTIKYKPIVTQHFTISSKHKCLCIQVISRSSIPTKSYVNRMHRVISLDVHLLSLTQCYTITKVPLLLNRLTIKLLRLTCRLLILILYRSLLPKSSLILIESLLTKSSLLLTKSSLLLSKTRLLLTKTSLLLSKPLLHRNSALISECLHALIICLWIR